MPSLKVKIRDALKHVLNVFAYREKVYDLPKNGGPFLVGFDCIQYRLYCIKRDKEDDLLALKHHLLCLGTSIVSDGILFQKQ